MKSASDDVQNSFLERDNDIYGACRSAVEFLISY
jgi:hypothetical protein